jgi:integrase
MLGARCPLLAEDDHGSWYFAFDTPTLPSGDRRRVRRGGFATHQAAQRELDALRDPAVALGAVLTVSAWLKLWLEEKVVLRESTRRSYSELSRNHLVPTLGEICLADLNAQHVTAMLEEVRARHARGGAPVSEGTVARVYATLRAALNCAVRDGLIPVNPALLVKPGGMRRPRAVVWTEDRVEQWRRDGIRPPVAVWTATQTAQFLHQTATDWLYAVFHLIALRGLRRGEAAGLRWCDADLDSGTIYIDRQLQQRDGQVVQAPLKTNSSRRAVALDTTTASALRRHRMLQRSEARALGRAPSGYVFTNEHGDPVTPDYLTRRFAELLANTDLPPIRLHDLRHVAASLAIQAGADLKVIQDQLGHSSIVITADTYVSILPEHARKAAENTAGLIARAGRKPPGARRPRRPAQPM